MKPEPRTPPQALDIEKQIIGAMINDSQLVPKIIEKLSTGDFYSPNHQRYYTAMVRMFNEGMPIDLTSLANALKQTGEYNAKHDSIYLVESTSVCTSENATYYAAVVKELSVKRNLIVIGNEIANKAFCDTEDAIDLLEYAQGEIYRIGSDTFKKGARELKDIIYDVSETISKRDPSLGITGIDTYIQELNEITLGFNEGLIIVAGRPSSGKTSFILGRAIDIAQEKHVVFFSQEMSDEELTIKLLASAAMVDHTRLKLNRLSNEEWQRVLKASGKLSKAKLYIDESPSLSITELRAKAMQYKNKGKLDLVVVDYLQLMKLPKSNDSMTDKVGYLSGGCKALSKELKVPVIVLSQLNRALEGRVDKRPTKADLRSSGNIEQDADVILFIHRPEMYGEQSYTIGNEVFSDMNGFASIIVDKNRNGSIGEVPLRFGKELGGVFHSFNRIIEAPPIHYTEKQEKRDTLF